MKAEKRIISWCLALCFFAATALLCGCSLKKEVKTAAGVEFIMNTFVEQRWYGDNAQKNYDETVSALRDIESSLSLYIEDSEISRLNAAAGKHPVALSDDCYSLLKEAAQYCEQSGGLFDITIAPLTIVWGITEENPTIPSDEEIEKVMRLVGYKDIIFDDAAKTVMLAREGMSIDLGGIAKGMAAGKMRRYAEQNNVEGFISIGGNMMVRGKKPDGGDFVIGIRDPRGEQNEFIATVTLDGLTMATTGDYERYFEKDGVRYHHVLDPFTGRPSDSDLISVTVISENGTLADCLSTSIFLQGSGSLEKYLTRDDCMIVAVTKDKDVYISPALKQRLKTNSQKSEYRFRF